MQERTNEIKIKMVKERTWQLIKKGLDGGITLRCDGYNVLTIEPEGLLVRHSYVSNVVQVDGNSQIKEKEGK